jgi:opacity protein-like surface antigen
MLQPRPGRARRGPNERGTVEISPKEAFVNVRLAALLTGGALLCGTPARAQAPTAARPAATASSLDEWTGFYFGGSLGAAPTTFTAPITLAGFTASGLTVATGTVTVGPASAGSLAAGLHVGYGFKLTPTLLAAGELQLAHLSPSLTQSAFVQAAGSQLFLPTDSFTVSSGRVTSLRGRVGTPMRHGLLVYGTVGVAITTVTGTGAFPALTRASGTLPAAAGTDSHTMKGVTLGVGADYAPFRGPGLRSVTIGAEFRHTSFGTVAFDFGNVTVNQPPPLVEPATGAVSVSANEFDIRVNVRLKMWR